MRFVRAQFFGWLAVGLMAAKVWAGGSGLNVIVVVNQNSSNSLQLGNAYCEQRGVPPQNVLRITNWTGGFINWSPVDFRTQLRDPLLSMLASRGLTHQAIFVVLSMDIPYRVQDGAGNENSTTSALFYGFKTNGPPVAGVPSCSLPNLSSNSYAFSEMPFPLAVPNTARTNSFLAMMLTDTNLAAAESILRRGVAADSTFPTQTVYLAKTSDQARNVRFQAFDNSVFDNRVVGHTAVASSDTDSTAFTNLFGLQTGLASFSLAPDAFVPGAIADTLTSFGGFLFEYSGQTPLLAWLEAGASGSYGTVVEPCNYTQKFPDPLDYFYQARGFTLAESYYQSVLNPFQGVMVGEPLTAPFARPGSADWSSLTNRTQLHGLAALNPVFTAAASNLPLAQADLFVDGTFFQTVTNLPLAAGNVLSATLNGLSINYTVPPNSTLASAAVGLASAINLQASTTHVRAFPVGDRIELQSLLEPVPGSAVTVNASTAAGSAATLTSWLSAASPTFLDTVANGYEVVTIYHAPVVGDWLQFTFVKTNGVKVTLGVTNTVAGTQIGTLAQALVGLINSSAPLQAADGLTASDFFDETPYGLAAVQFFLYANTPGWPASQIQSTLTCSTNLVCSPLGAAVLADNVSDLRPRNHLYLSSGVPSLTAQIGLDTAQLADGWHELSVVAYEGTSVATQTRVERKVVIQNTSLTATISASPAGVPAALGQPLQFTVTAGPTNIAWIELFSTGGSLGVVSNQSAANFQVATIPLGSGLHPFYAVVTDTQGHQYRTETDWIRIQPASTLGISLSGQGESHGFLIHWIAPTNELFQVQWSAAIPTDHWQSFSNLIGYTGPITPTNGWFSFFDDGSQFPLGTTRYYRLVLLAGNTPPVLPSGGKVYFLNPLATLSVTNTATDADLPSNSLAYVLSSSVADTNHLPAIDANSGIITWTPSVSQAGTSNLLTTVVTDNGLPRLSATNSFVVEVNPIPVIRQVSWTTNGFFQLDWFGATNDYFLVETATNLNPPVVWTANGAYVYPFASNYFRFTDSNRFDGSRFFRLLTFP